MKEELQIAKDNVKDEVYKFMDKNKWMIEGMQFNCSYKPIAIAFRGLLTYVTFLFDDDVDINYLEIMKFLSVFDSSKESGIVIKYLNNEKDPHIRLRDIYVSNLLPNSLPTVELTSIDILNSKPLYVFGVYLIGDVVYKVADTDAQMKRLHKQIEATHKCEHVSGVVPITGYVIHKGYVVGITMPYKGEPVKRNCSSEVSTILHKIHETGVIHGDVRRPNILDDGNKLWIIDIGAVDGSIEEDLSKLEMF